MAQPDPEHVLKMQNLFAQAPLSASIKEVGLDIKRMQDQIEVLSITQTAIFLHQVFQEFPQMDKITFSVDREYDDQRSYSTYLSVEAFDSQGEALSSEHKEDSPRTGLDSFRYDFHTNMTINEYIEDRIMALHSQKDSYHMYFLEALSDAPLTRKNTLQQLGAACDVAIGSFYGSGHLHNWLGAKVAHTESTLISQTLEESSATTNIARPKSKPRSAI